MKPSSSWLTNDIDRDDQWREEFCKNIHIDMKTLRRWESLETKKLLRSYTQIGKALGEDEDDIKARHLKAKQILHLAKTPVNSKLLASLATALDEGKVFDDLAATPPLDGVKTNQEIAVRISEAFQQRDFTLIEDVGNAITQAIDKTQDIESIEAIENLIRTIALSASTSANEGSEPEHHKIEDPGKLCLLRAHIDANLVEKGYEIRVPQYIKPISKTALTPDCKFAVRLGDVKNTNSHYRLWRMLHRLDKKELKDSKVPRPNNDTNIQAFNEFCERFNLLVKHEERSDKHYFVLACDSESSEFKKLLKDKLNHLNLYEIHKHGRLLLRVDKLELEVWLAKTLFCCKTRKKALSESLKNPAHERATDREQVEDKQKAKCSLEQSLEYTDPDNPDHNALRQAPHELMEATKRGGEVKQSSPDKLDRALKGATLVEKAAGVASKVIQTFS